MAGTAMQGRDFAEAHDRLLAEDIQFAFEDVPPPEPPPAWLEALLSAVAEPMMWLILGAGLIVIAVLIARAIIGSRWRPAWRRRGAAAEEAEWRPDEAAARSLLAEAEALAARGAYEEAVHLILRRSVEDISEKLPDFLLPSLTARDIAAAGRLPASARAAFGAIAAIVERALFAQRPVGEAGWLDARKAYERFAFAGAWEGGAA